jgi:YhcH/YjgK/YiaL family protein
VLEGDEQMGWKPLADCFNPVSEHNMEKDIRFFHDAPASWVAVPPDHFCIFFPEDAHAPLVASGRVRKVIFKVAVSPTL